MASFPARGGVLVLLVILLIYSCNGHDKLGKLRGEVRELKAASVRLTLDSSGYQVVRHQLGSATFSLKDVRAHDQGSAITLEIGNMTSVPITGAAMELGYQDPSDSSLERSSEYHVQQTLEPGRATRVTLILKGVPPSAVTYIRVSNLQPKGVRLLHAN